MTPGEQFRADLDARWEFSDAEAALVAQAVDLVDEIAKMRAAIDDMGAVVTGSRKQPVPNPMLAQVRAHRLALASILGRLRIVGVVTEEPEPADRHAAGLAGARARWERRTGASG